MGVLPHAHAHMNAHNYVQHMRASTCMHTHTHAHAHTHAHTCTHTHTQTHVCTRMHAHTRTHTHTHTHTNDLFHIKNFLLSYCKMRPFVYIYICIYIHIIYSQNMTGAIEIGRAISISGGCLLLHKELVMVMAGYLAPRITTQHIIVLAGVCVLCQGLE